MLDIVAVETNNSDEFQNLAFQYDMNTFGRSKFEYISNNTIISENAKYTRIDIGKALKGK